MITDIQSEEKTRPSLPQRLLDHPVTGLLISALGLIPEAGPYIELGVSAGAIALRKALANYQKAKEL